MDRARRGYVLIVTLAGLALCTALLGAYAATSRRAITLARVDIQSAQAQYAARGAAIQAAKDLSVGLGRGRIGVEMAGDSLPGAGSGTASTTIDGLPAFPPEMANAAGFLGILGRRMEEIRAGAAQREDPTETPAGAEPGDTSGAERDDMERAESEAAPLAHVVVTGLGMMEFDGARVMISLESENGKINLNSSNRGVLRDLLLTLGHESRVADAMLDALEDHRLSLLAATSVARAAAPRREMDRPLGGRPLDRIEELLEVAGFSPSVYESLVPHCTVLGEGLLDPNYASEEALIAIGIQSPSLLKRVLEARLRREPLTALSMRQLLGPAVYNNVSEHLAYSLTPLFTVRARAEKGESVGRFMMRVTIGEAGTPVMLESREGWM